MREANPSDPAVLNVGLHFIGRRVEMGGKSFMRCRWTNCDLVVNPGEDMPVAIDCEPPIDCRLVGAGWPS